MQNPNAPVRLAVSRRTAWLRFSAICTSLIPSWLLRLCGLKSREMRNAWREKVALCWVIAVACGVLAFLTYGMSTIVCKSSSVLTPDNAKRLVEAPYVFAQGKVLRISDGHTLANYDGEDVTDMFGVESEACKSAFGSKSLSSSGKYSKTSFDDVGAIHHSWFSIVRKKYVVIGSGVYSPGDLALPGSLDSLTGITDATKASEGIPKEELQCFKDSFYVGEILTKSAGCQVADAFLYISSVAILGLVLARFFLAIAYSMVAKSRNWRLMINSNDSMPVILLTTCYSEGRDGLKVTLDSLCSQEYENKVMIVVADGEITGDGNDASTPEILKSLMIPLTGDSKNKKQGNETQRAMMSWSNSPQQYASIGAGSSKINFAEVHAGTYTVVTKSGPKSANILLVLKKENRGKRDSQMVIMNFFHRVLYKERMTPLDYDLYRKLKALSGKNPEEFGAILMVDADTSVRPGAVRTMARTMLNDENIMGLCGETLISNKFSSWVTAIQVFEYYVSHHLTKGFESIFGNVTCLPGCFCMYRIRAEKNEGYIPILTAPSVLNSYGSDETKTLHEKNLLLLGEDRFLTTLLLKNFPKRKLLFLPNALCDTVVPDKFFVLLSQRRRWINSTIHNLFELLKVDLCGTFCCSMQFVVALELFGTLVLPAAIVFTGVLIVSAIVRTPEWIPLILLLAILGLPAMLIFFTTLNILYFFWLVIYLVSLPIWNFVLPMYAFWHFDDFSWGETRKVNKDDKVKTHGEAEGECDHSQIIFKELEDYERGGTGEEVA